MTFPKETPNIRYEEILPLFIFPWKLHTTWVQRLLFGDFWPDS